MKNKVFNKVLAVVIALTMCISVFSINSKIFAENLNEENIYVFSDLAFPTAQGKGRFVNGFRGGNVVRVTNLNDSGEGSLRWALEEISGSRIVVFAIGGVIELESKITIDSEHGNVYIAGQTAPGDGITIIKHGILLSSTNDVVIRNLRIRHGEEEVYPSSCIDVIASDNCIIDHCSMSWSNGPVFNSRHSQNITVQNSILSEPLIDACAGGVDTGATGYYSIGTGILTDTGSFHHNIISNCMNRNICFWKTKNQELNSIEVANNLFFNWNYYGFQWHSLSLQIVNNMFKVGVNESNDYIFAINEDYDGKIYLEGNVLDNNKKDWDLVEVENITEEQLSEIKCNTPIISSGITIEPAEDAYDNLLKNSGAIVPKLDYIDKRYTEEIKSGEATYSGSRTGMKGYLNSVEDAEGYPDESTFKGGEAPSDTDTDGMPDEWEILHDLNPYDYYDACQVYLSDEGYTNIELYINELMGDPVKYSENPVVSYTPEKPEQTEMLTEYPKETPAEKPLTVGDIDLNGITDANDALCVLKHASKINMISENKIIIADVVGDGVIDAIDALMILKIAAKICE